MAHRHFLDEAGSEWTVYDVVPRADERRSRDRRNSPHESEPEPQDRRTEDRRALGSIRPVRLTRAWLCFEGQGERRRLQPVPENWHLLSDAELVGLLKQARAARRRAG